MTSVGGPPVITPGTPVGVGSGLTPGAGDGVGHSGTLQQAGSLVSVTNLQFGATLGKSAHLGKTKTKTLLLVLCGEKFKN